MTEINTYPYTLDQLKYFHQEIKEAGGFDKLMFRKKALKIKQGMTMIVAYENIDEYKEKYLTGIYGSLRSHYTTEVPYIFWCNLYIMLKKI